MRSSIRSAVEASAQRLLARREALLAIASFGASSVYWLALAFILPTASYGKMMTLQASVQLVTTLLGLRTFDLLFHLVSKLGYRIDSGFRVAAVFEALSVVAATLVCAIGAMTVQSGGVPPAMAVITLALLSSLATAQGASMAQLRYLEKPKVIAWADYVTMVFWGLAGISLLLFRNAPPIFLLIIGTLPPVTRTLVLGWAAQRSRSAADGRGFRAGDLGMIVKFLVSGQMVNFVKNSSVPVETMIVAAFCPPTSVAMYRLARSTLGATNAASNVSYQQGYSAFAQAETPERRSKILQRMRREGLAVSLVLYPVSVCFALIYALTKHNVDVVTLQLVTAGALLGFLPSVLQQGPKALLLVEGAHAKVNTAFAIGLAILALLSCAMFWLPSIATFLVALIVSAFARLAYFNWKARAYVRPVAPAETEQNR